MATARTAELNRLALGSNCHRCGASTDQECRTASGRVTQPHQTRVDRAVAQYVAAKDAQPATAPRSRCGTSLAGGGGPCQAASGHDGRGHDLTGQPWSHAYVAPCRRCGGSHPTAADRSVCPWTDQPVVQPVDLDAVEQLAAAPSCATPDDRNRLAVLRAERQQRAARLTEVLRSLPPGGTLHA